MSSSSLEDNFHDDPLEAALSSSFTHTPDLPPASSQHELTLPDADASIEPTAPSATPPGDGSWKAEYEERLAGWRAEAAIARQKAEEQRMKWERIRAKEEAEGSAKDRGPPTAAEGGWETVERGKTSDVNTPEDSGVSTMNSSYVDARDLGSGESERRMDHGSDNSQPIQPDDSDDINSLIHSRISSFPSIDFPSSSEHAAKSNKKSIPDLTLPTPPPPSATLSIFDTSLSKRSRLLALATSIAINFCLPFVNGVMLGFGEIFAKNVVDWIRAKRSTPSVARLGIGTSSRR